MESDHLVIKFKQKHSHSIDSKLALRKLDMGFEAKEFLLDKYSQGHNPSSALDLLKSKNFKIDSGRLADRSLVPSQADSYRYVYLKQSIKLLDQCRAL